MTQPQSASASAGRGTLGQPHRPALTAAGLSSLQRRQRCAMHPFPRATTRGCNSHWKNEVENQKREREREMIRETGLLTHGRSPGHPSLPTLIPGHIKVDAIQAAGPLMTTGMHFSFCLKLPLYFCHHPQFTWEPGRR